MLNLKLQPADVLVEINRSNDLYSSIRRWALGSPYDHVFLYMGRMGLITDWKNTNSLILRVPMLFESYGRGCALRSLSERYGVEVVVMRAKYNWVEAKLLIVLENAIKLASDKQAYYDYLSIPRYVLPRLICEKLGMPMPLKYHRNPFHICSEAIFEIFYLAELVDILFDYCSPPLPGDFVINTPILEKVGEIRLSEEVV